MFVTPAPPTDQTSSVGAASTRIPTRYRPVGAQNRIYHLSEVYGFQDVPA
jgi:hypothetical protein